MTRVNPRVQCARNAAWGAVCTRAVGAGGAIAPPQILADQLSLCQLGVQIMPTTLILASPPSGFPDLPTALYTMQDHYKSVPRVT